VGGEERGRTSLVRVGGGERAAQAQSSTGELSAALDGGYWVSITLNPPLFALVTHSHTLLP